MTPQMSANELGWNAQIPLQITMNKVTFSYA